MQLVYTLSLHGICIEPQWWETNGEVEHYRRSHIGPPGRVSTVLSCLRLELVLMTTGEGRRSRDQRRFEVSYIRDI